MIPRQQGKHAYECNTYLAVCNITGETSQIRQDTLFLVNPPGHITTSQIQEKYSTKVKAVWCPAQNGYLRITPFKILSSYSLVGLNIVSRRPPGGHILSVCHIGVRHLLSFYPCLEQQLHNRCMTILPRKS
jgi:hypothetical protein